MGAAGETPTGPPGSGSATPSVDQRIATGWTGPVVVEVPEEPLTEPLPEPVDEVLDPVLREGTLTLDCPSTGYHHQTTFPTEPGTVEVAVAPVEEPAADCTARASLDDPLTHQEDQVGFSAWDAVGFTDARRQPGLLPHGARRVRRRRRAAPSSCRPTPTSTCSSTTSRSGRVVREENAELGGRTAPLDLGRHPDLTPPRGGAGAGALPARRGGHRPGDPALRRGHRPHRDRAAHGHPRTVRTVPAVQTTRELHGACATRADCRRGRASCAAARGAPRYAELSEIVLGAARREAAPCGFAPRARRRRPAPRTHAARRSNVWRHARSGSRCGSTAGAPSSSRTCTSCGRGACSSAPGAQAPAPSAAGIVGGQVTRQDGQWHIDLDPPG